MPNICETAGVSLSTDAQGRHWEHFWINGEYSFSNQIPNRRSFTTTNPGEVFFQRGLCVWNGQQSPTPTAQNNQASTLAQGEGGAAGLLLLAAVVCSGIYAWFTRDSADSSGDYHPMADAPPLPLPPGRWELPEPTQGNTAQPSVIDWPQPSQASNDAAFSAPWDEPSSAVIDPSSTVIDPSSTVIDDAVTGPFSSLDKLKGISLKQFKDQLCRLGITPESGCFRSVELLKYPGTTNLIEIRMMQFWREFGSTRVPHAIYFVFGLQDGGNRSPEFKEQYETAKVWITNWFQENLPHE